MNVSPVVERLKSVSNKQCVLFLQKRFRYKKKWAVNLPNRTPCELALEHFDAFYKPLFGQKWPSVRVALLSLPKYAAIINNVGEPETATQRLLELGATDLIQDTARVALEKGLYGSSWSESSGEGSASTAECTAVTGAPDEFHPYAGTESGNDQKLDTPFMQSSNVQFRSKSLGSKTTEETGTPGSLPAQQTKGSCSEALDATVRKDSQSWTDKSMIKDLKNVLPPDALYNSSDLEHFMPTQQVFSEKEQLRREEHAVSTFEERTISLPIIAGVLPALPPSLRVMAFPRGNVTDFPSPTVQGSKVLNYYLLDAASILPVIALDLKPYDSVLDLCAAPGGKTLAMLQMIIKQGGHLVSSDCSQSRLNRLRTVLRSYLPAALQEDFVSVAEKNGIAYSQPLYKKVLVDVPCNSDRHVLTTEDNNLFKAKRINDRLQMTTLQKDLLIAGIKSCKPGGSVVYSTCTLAAVQNDGVVQRAMEELLETTDINVAVEDLSLLREAFSPVFQFHTHTRLGQLILPSLVSNFGPMYFCKLRRL